MFFQVTLSPALIVTSEGSNTRPPPSAPSFTVAALAARVRAREAAETPAALANLRGILDFRPEGGPLLILLAGPQSIAPRGC